MRATGHRVTTADTSVRGEREALLDSSRHGDSTTMDSEDSEKVQFIVDMPPLLLVQAGGLLYIVGNSAMPMTPSRAMSDFANECPRKRGGRVDILTLMWRLWLLDKALDQPNVRMSELLGGMIAGTTEVTLRVPSSGFQLEHVSWQSDCVQLTKLAEDVEATWAYISPDGVDSCMMLRSEPEGKIVCLHMHSRYEAQPPVLTEAVVAKAARSMVRVPGLIHVLLLVTDRLGPVQPSFQLLFSPR